ncbi:putative ankyrin repeat domain-containing protein 19 isoform X2 [Marmota marmota marmota]|uniref:putative ankyrin repeat domain-containing protein 19 isoform X2 n=1 Tax=Marmota marmota marmota TaxID=9994 RepID=UPI002092230B|nr:putative ankyrin repeat domain-containing protein 19 isoform X2 [Marmota marmota marmota]
MALQYLEEKCATILLENGADPNAHNNQNETPLHFALSLKKTSLVEKLLSLNADIEARTTRGYTPLLLAIEQNRQQMVETLIQNKANIHAVDQKGRTALMFALEQKSKHVVEMLLQSGIDVSAADNFGQMALAYAIASGDTNLKELILQYMKVESKHPENINPGKTSESELIMVFMAYIRKVRVCQVQCWQACNRVAQEAEARGLQVQSQPQQFSKALSNLARHFLKNYKRTGMSVSG